MTIKQIKLALAATVVMGAGALVAQEMGQEHKSVQEEQLDAAEVAIKLVAEQADSINKKQREIDSGKTYLISNAQELVAMKLGCIKKGKNKKGEDEYLKNGYDEATDSIIVTGVASAIVDDPANDETFIEVRNMKLLEAYLDAKEAIIRSLETTFDATVRSSTQLQTVPAQSEAENQFKAKLDELENKRQKLANKLEDLDERQASKVRGQSLGPKFKYVLQDVAKKIDGKKYDTDEKNKLCQELKDEFKSFNEEIDLLNSLAEELEFVPQNQLNFGIALMSQMPLLGANVLTGAESWDEKTGEYQIAVAVVWSPKLQKRAVAIAEGEFEAEKKGAYTINEWMEQQDLSCIVGPRRFVDDRGRNINLGFAAADMSCSPTQRKGKRQFADSYATAFVIFSLYGDIEAYREANASYADFHNTWTKRDKAKFASKLFSKVSNSAQGLLRGCMPLAQFAKEYTHELSGKRIYVAPYHLNPKLAKKASEFIDKSFEDAKRISRRTSYDIGRRNGQRAALNEIRESSADHDRGFADGKGMLLNERGKKADQVSEAERSAIEIKEKATEAPRKAKSGVFSGDAAIDTDF